MGCTSSQAIIKKPESKNQHHGRETPNQARREKIFLGTDSLVSQAADDSCGRGLPEDGMKGSQSIKEQSKSQHMGAITSLSKLETERQTSSDILEELRMQGIIKTSCPTTKNRTADDDIMLVPAERTLQKPPAKLEKLELKEKKLHALSTEDSENKTREEQLKKDLLTDRSSPIIPPEKGVQIGSSIITIPNSFQLPSLSVGTETWSEKEELDDNINNGFEDFTMVESDITYNTIDGVF
ncbi:stathmin domain-containing protein 1 isoform X1 [Pantherophis guttatus]|uniref:Stathmin domain-containing protein 1 isoform X1 n=1 Tax=Pantherophis guttatus TaxID=94885 RepID=A0A6P9D043_PANGU|nr:stathmin domain-containing protein 1 isoform X1 [Pantherophis guttatus]